MPNYTDNYNLIKPKKEENYDVNETTNNNMDIIDSELYKRVQKVPGKGLSSNDFTNEYIKKINQMGEAKRGFTFTPSVSEEGIISWTNDGELDNPNPVNIKGPQGAIGPQGPQGVQGEQGIQGIQGPQGLTGPANNITIGTVTKGDEAQASITGQAPNQILNLTLPKGDKGDDGAQGEKGETGETGPANTLSIGSVTSGETASATITGDAPNQTLNLILPKGEKGESGPQGATGPANTLSIGIVSSGTSPDATITGQAPNQVLNLVLPKGEDGNLQYETLYNNLNGSNPPLDNYVYFSGNTTDYKRLLICFELPNGIRRSIIWNQVFKFSVYELQTFWYTEISNHNSNPPEITEYFLEFELYTTFIELKKAGKIVNRQTISSNDNDKPKIVEVIGLEPI